MVRPIFSVVGGSIFERPNHLPNSTWQCKIDIVLKSKIGFNEALENYAKIILLYVQNLHENTDARIIGLYSNVYDYNAEDDFSSLVDPWTLKPKSNIGGTF